MNGHWGPASEWSVSAIIWRVSLIPKGLQHVAGGGAFSATPPEIKFKVPHPGRGASLLVMPSQRDSTGRWYPSCTLENSSSLR